MEGTEHALDEISSENEMLLLDTSGINPIQRRDNKNRFSAEGKMQYYSDTNAFLRALISSLNSEYVWNVSPGIFSELSSANKNHFSFNSKYLFRRKGARAVEKADLFKEIQGADNRWRVVVDLFSNGGIVELSDGEKKDLSKFYSIFSHFAKPGYFKKTGGCLSQADFELLGYGVSLAKGGTKTAIVSNDIPMAFAFSEVCERVSGLEEKLGFYLRKDFPFFVQWATPNSSSS